MSNSKHVCGSGDTVTSVTNVYCHCDVSCCLSMDPEWLQMKFLADGRKQVNKIPCFVGYDCSRVLQMVEGTFRDTYFFIWNSSPMGVIKNCREVRVDVSRSAATSSAMDERHIGKSEICP